jgi:hypothetical protein
LDLPGREVVVIEVRALVLPKAGIRSLAMSGQPQADGRFQRLFSLFVVPRPKERGVAVNNFIPFSPFR